MPFEKLMQLVQNYIANAQPEQAINLLQQWAYDNHQSQLATAVAILSGEQKNLTKDRTLGMIDNRDQVLRQSQINYRMGVKAICPLFDVL